MLHARPADGHDCGPRFEAAVAERVLNLFDPSGRFYGCVFDNRKVEQLDAPGKADLDHSRAVLRYLDSKNPVYHRQRP
jgi:hypothetical protein